jgi:hypothetical protein
MVRQSRSPFSSLDEVSAALRGGPRVAEAYAAALLAVAEMLRLDGYWLPRRTLELAASGRPFSVAFRDASGLELPEFESAGRDPALTRRLCWAAASSFQRFAAASEGRVMTPRRAQARGRRPSGAAAMACRLRANPRGPAPAPARPRRRHDRAASRRNVFERSVPAYSGSPAISGRCLLLLDNYR